MAKRPSIGRQKIKIAKIEVKNHLQVTFSKRRSGLFKKASELCILCGAEIAIIVFSPAGKVFSFGHPNVDPIVDRFLSWNPSHHHHHPTSGNPAAAATAHLVEAHRNAAVREMNLQLTEMIAELEVERKRGEALDRMREESRRSRCWWEAPIADLGLPELQQLWDSMDELKNNVNVQVEGIMTEVAVNASAFLPVNETSAATAGIFDKPETKPPRMLDNAPHHHALHDFGYHHEFF